MFEKRFYYGANLVKVIDGDTIDVSIDLGFKISQEVRLRLARIDAPEKRGSDREQGLMVTESLIHFLKSSDALVVNTQKTGKYGRYIAEVYAERSGDWINVNNWLVESGYAIKL